ncbi:TIGR04283 family arsenosugar biosynthesis glycosyltransferase [Roseicella aerolata]|uniref:TIGR04283 family arsenosugar biosynthesis glycosyltransferase n=1 Tax=Roseicella aerolata TaxID=2883479 RepID=A0A9X1ICT6_9PROT|nr:TIGR04283 family arsenosugar biosynthesis glycosyltransferase [Roseicella aerolata]MCB4822162.1 TIGR04283 family arsenosugar biosynthesis glycosyltransferase [Roseicella aerolata]
MEQTLSIVIPTLNAAGSLGRMLAACAEARTGMGAELVVADGGSSDGTPSLAEAAGARLVAAPRGRGPQLAAGATAARGDWLLFLHADTRLAPGWAAAARGFLVDPANAGRAAYFTFALDDASPEARRLERRVAWRCRALALPYGDQGLLLSRTLYDAVGGYRPIPLMEDVDLVRRLGRRRLAALPVPAVTSAERWRREGWRRRSARNLLCLSLWFLGVPPRLIQRVYA